LRTIVGAPERREGLRPKFSSELLKKKKEGKRHRRGEKSEPKSTNPGKKKAVKGKKEKRSWISTFEEGKGERKSFRIGAIRNSKKDETLV